MFFMFYLKEIYFRFNYILFSFFICFIICYNYKSFLLFLITSGLQSYLDNNKIFEIDHLIYTHPIELFSVQFSIILYFSTLINFPYISWQVLDFLKSGLIFYEYKNFIKLMVCLLCIIIFTNKLCFFTLFPTFWFFFESFNNSIATGQIFNYFLELKINEYFNFVLDFIYLVNILLMVLILFFIFSYFYGLKNLLYWKKLFIFLNIVFATLLSPPDVYTQLVIFLLLSIFIELMILFLIYYSKLSKYFIKKVTY